MHCTQTQCACWRALIEMPTHPLLLCPPLPPCSRFLQGRDTDKRTVDELKTAIRAGRECTVRLLNYTKAGRPFWNMLTVAQIRWVGGVMHGLAGLAGGTAAAWPALQMCTI